MCCSGLNGIVPGCCHEDPNWVDFRRGQQFNFVNGFAIPKDEFLGPSGPINCGVGDCMDIFGYNPELTYGKPKERPLPPVVPSYVTLENKVLRFLGYYKETVNDSCQEIYRVRNVDIHYYLEDDSMMVSEPRTENSGLPQGKFLKRHRIPKNDIGETYSWKDLNLCCDIMFYSRVFRLCDCDPFTKEFYESEGIILNEPERIPKDPYTDRRSAPMQRKLCNPVKCPDSHQDARYKFLMHGSEALRFSCVWDDRDSAFGGLKRVELAYFLADDMVEVRLCLEHDSSSDSNALLLHKTTLPKDWKDFTGEFPIAYMEPRTYGYIDYYGPKDFYIGATVNVFGRRFLVCDIMDEFTRNYYRENFGYSDFTPMQIEMGSGRESFKENCPPPWNGWGTPKDSLDSCLRVTPNHAPVVDVDRNRKYLIMSPKSLAYKALLDSTRPEDTGREFKIIHRLYDDKIGVMELSVRNSGWPGGKFLDFVQIPKPGYDPNCPEYYGLGDLYIGGMVDFFGHRFVIQCADKEVEEFLRTNPQCFPKFVQENLRDYFKCKADEGSKPREEKSCDRGYPVCEEPLLEGFFENLGLGLADKVSRNRCDENPSTAPVSYEWDRSTSGGDTGVGTVEPCLGNPNAFEAQEPTYNSRNNSYNPCPSHCALMSNPVLNEEPQPINPEEYYVLKNHRFDFANVPDDPSKWKGPYPCPQIPHLYPYSYGLPCSPVSHQQQQQQQGLLHTARALNCSQRPYPGPCGGNNNNNIYNINNSSGACRSCGDTSRRCGCGTS